MADTSKLQEQIDSGQRIMLAEIDLPKTADAAAVKAAAARLKDKVQAIGISDNRDGVTMSALAGTAIVVGEGIEPILHLVTRDRNRVALVSDFLGAQALGIKNVLCTSGTHQTLGAAKSARNVYDLDSVQLVKALSNLGTDASAVGESAINGFAPACLGAKASPAADPMDLQIMRLAKKVKAGAKYIITQPVFDLDRFNQWWDTVKARGLQEKVAVIAGIKVFTDAAKAKAYADQRPSPRVPAAIQERLAAGEGVAVATEIARKLLEIDGIRGLEFSSDDDGTAIETVINGL